MRELPGVEKRVESGAIRFGSDWPGLFLRGDNAFAIAAHISRLLQFCQQLDPALIDKWNEDTKQCIQYDIRELTDIMDFINTDVILHPFPDTLTEVVQHPIETPHQSDNHASNNQ